jgi:hypothetical protein
MLDDHAGAIRLSREFIRISRSVPLAEFDYHSAYLGLASCELDAGKIVEARQSLVCSISRVLPARFVELIAITLEEIANLDRKTGRSDIGDSYEGLATQMRRSRGYR